MDLISIASIMVIVYIALTLLIRTVLVVVYSYFMYKLFSKESTLSDFFDEDETDERAKDEELFGWRQDDEDPRLYPR